MSPRPLGEGQGVRAFGDGRMKAEGGRSPRRAWEGAANYVPSPSGRGQGEGVWGRKDEGMAGGKGVKGEKGLKGMNLIPNP
jgi:hypothetical protein